MANFSLALSGASGKEITYGYTINAVTTTASDDGVDYTLTAGTNTISAVMLQFLPLILQLMMMH